MPSNKASDHNRDMKFLLYYFGLSPVHTYCKNEIKLSSIQWKNASCSGNADDWPPAEVWFLILVKGVPSRWMTQPL